MYQDIYGMEPQSWQRDVLSNWKSGYLLVKAARRTGKDMLCAMLALQTALSREQALIVCPTRHGVESFYEKFKTFSGNGRYYEVKGQHFRFDVECFATEARVLVRCAADYTEAKGWALPACKVGIVNDAAWAADAVYPALVPCCKHLMLISSWRWDAGASYFGRKWREGGLAWQRLEAAADLDWAKTIAGAVSDEYIYEELLLSPREIGRAPSA